MGQEGDSDISWTRKSPTDKRQEGKFRDGVIRHLRAHLWQWGGERRGRNPGAGEMILQGRERTGIPLAKGFNPAGVELGQESWGRGI